MCFKRRWESSLCWGAGNFGQLGSGYEKASSFPLYVRSLDYDFLTNIKQVSSGGSHTCVLTNEGEVFCFGEGERGQLGNGKNENSLFPTAVLNPEGDKPLTNIKQISGWRSEYLCFNK